MNLSQLHERLRLEVLRRIQRGALSNSLLARQTGFRPAHISNFLHCKRKLSLHAMDRLLEASSIALDELLGSAIEADRDPGDDIPFSSDTLTFPVVSQAAAIHDHYIPSHHALDQLTVPAAMLAGVRRRCSSSRQKWQRFVAVRLTEHQAAPMHPVLKPHSLAVIDRHYCSPSPYHLADPTLYAVRYGNALRFRYASFDAGHIILRPYNFSHEIELLDLDAGESPYDVLIGRICLSLAPI